MFRGVFSKYRLYYCAHIPGLTNVNVFDDPNDKKKLEPKNGTERVIALLETDEQGELRKEVVSSIQITLGSGFCLAFYGGIKHSKGAFENWVALNSTTLFRTGYQAKRALQDHITLEFGKYFIIYGLKGILFTGILMFTLIAVSAYRDKNGILEYFIAGLTAGSLMRITHGLRGMISGAFVGSGLATFSGLILNFLMKISNMTIDDVRKWQYDMRRARKDLIRQLEHKADEDPVSESFKHYTTRMTQRINNDDGDDENKVFVLIKEEINSVTDHDVPKS